MKTRWGGGDSLCTRRNECCCGARRKLRVPPPSPGVAPSSDSDGESDAEWQHERERRDGAGSRGGDYDECRRKYRHAHLAGPLRTPRSRECTVVLYFYFVRIL